MPAVPGQDQPVRQNKEWDETLILVLEELQCGYVQKSKLYSALWTAFISTKCPGDPG